MPSFGELSAPSRRDRRTVGRATDWARIERETRAWLRKYAPRWQHHPFAQGFVANRLGRDALTAESLEATAKARDWESSR